MTRHRMLASIVAFCLTAGPVPAKPPPDANPVFSPWFESLADPETGLSCCGEADCRPATERIASDHYEVFISEAWIAVPEEKILRRTGNPTGRAVLCWSPVFGIMCFVPGPGV